MEKNGHESGKKYVIVLIAMTWTDFEDIEM